MYDARIVHYGQPHHSDRLPQKSPRYKGPLEGRSSEEIRSLVLEGLEALDLLGDMLPPPYGLPGIARGYSPRVLNLLLAGSMYLSAVLEGQTRVQRSLHDDIARELKELYGRGFKDALAEIDQAETLRLQEAGEAEIAARVDDVPATVYFIQSESGPIKIGIAIDVDKRQRGLQTAHPAPLKLLATCDGGAEQERAYHSLFAAHRLHGEWFEPHPDILAEVSRLTQHEGDA